MTGKNDDWWDNIPDPARWLIIGALLSSVGSGAINFNKDTTDRFKGADFSREIAIRDDRIRHLEQDVRELQVYRIDHTQHATKYTERIDEMWTLINRVPADEVNSSIRDLKQRVRELELEAASK